MANLFEPHRRGGWPHGRREQRRPYGNGGALPALEAVVETECAALMALRASRARMRFLPGDYGSAEADLGGAIELLQRALAELRAHVGGDAPSLLALGFVLRNEDRPWRQLPPGVS